MMVSILSPLSSIDVFSVYLFALLLFLLFFHYRISLINSPFHFLIIFCVQIFLQKVWDPSAVQGVDFGVELEIAKVVNTNHCANPVVKGKGSSVISCFWCKREGWIVYGLVVLGASIEDYLVKYFGEAAFLGVEFDDWRVDCWLRPFERDIKEYISCDHWIDDQYMQIYLQI